MNVMNRTTLPRRPRASPNSDRAMRILFLVSCVTAHDEKFVRSFSEAGHIVRIFSFHWREVPEALLQLPNVTLTRVHLQFLARAQRFLPVHLLPRLKRVIREFRPDVMHAGNTWNEGYLAALSGFHPLLVIPYGSDVLLDTQRSFLFRRANRAVFRAADWVACDAEHLKRKIVADFGYPPEQITIFPKGIDVESIARLRDPLRAAVRKELDWEKHFVLVMSRNHEPVYGIDVFLRAMERVVKVEPRCRVLMMGEGSLTAGFKEWVSTHGMDGYFRWMGKTPRTDLLRLLQAGDAYVSASVSDGTSVSLLEAMASRMPVVVSDVPSNLEWVKEGYNGEIFPRGDETTLASKILMLAADPVRSQEYGDRNLAVVRERGDWGRSYRELERIYSRLIKKGKVR